MDHKLELPAPMADAKAVAPKEHPRFPNIWVKPLLTSTENPFASVNVVQVPPGGVIGLHIHPQQVETIYALAGASTFTVGGVDVPFNAGQIVAVPIGMEHGLRNDGPEPVELLTFFTPPFPL